MNTAPDENFQSLKSKLEGLKRAYLAGADVYSEFEVTARNAAQVYNAEAARVAKQFGRRARTVTAAGLMR